MTHAEYRLEDGSRVPSVTTIIGKFKDAGPLMWWAWNEGREGRDFRETRDRAASIGTIAHDMVECHIRGWNFDINKYGEVSPEDHEKAGRSFKAFLNWADSSHLAPSHTEMRLISEEHRFGGTLDAMLVNGELALGDWKTSNGIYPDYLIQVAGGYHLLWNENFPDQPITGGFHILRFDKEHGDFHHHMFTDAEDAIAAFLHMRELYDIMARLKKRVK